MEKVDYIMLDQPDLPEWSYINGLFDRMYSLMDEMGLMLPLSENGTEQWIKTAKNTSGKYGLVILVKVDDKAAGFNITPQFAVGGYFKF